MEDVCVCVFCIAQRGFFEDAGRRGIDIDLPGRRESETDVRLRESLV